jgi:S-methylmethionine-dependent homocysteine/selenocysteine methylase
VVRERVGAEALRARLRAGPPLLLDGALGTELERHGAPATLPLWSTHALLRDPELVLRVHADYVAAGAELLTANTFRTQRRVLARAGIGERARELTTLAVSLARRAASEARSEPKASEGRAPATAAEARSEPKASEGRAPATAAEARSEPKASEGRAPAKAGEARSEPKASEGRAPAKAGEARSEPKASGGPDGRVLVLGSAPTLEDCYRPDLVPAADALAREHAEHAENLAAAGADAILIETMNTLREAVAAARAAREVGLPFLVSFACWEGDALLGGEPLAQALAAAADTGPDALLVNCLPCSNVAACLPALRAAGPPFGVYANLGAPGVTSGPGRTEPYEPDAFAAQAAHWLGAGARVVGGCCGTTPEHIRALAALLAPR